MASHKPEPTADLESLVEEHFGELKVAPASDHVFVLPVESVSDDRSSVKVRLCTGGFLDVPIAALKSARRMGQIQVDAEKFEVASGEIDRSSSSGRLLQQVAIELRRVAGGLRVIHSSATVAPAPESPTQIAPQPLDYNLPPTTIKSSFTGTAGQPVRITYTAPQYQYLFTENISVLDYISKHVTFGNCRLADPEHFHSALTETITPSGLRVVNGIVLYLEALPNTPLGQTYFASVGIEVTLVQETT